MKRIFRFFLIFQCFFVLAYAQQNFPVNGLSRDKKIIYAFTNAKIYVDYKTIITNATLLVSEDKVIDVGTAVVIPKEALIIDLQGKSIYPSFIDIYSDYGISQTEKTKFKEGPQYESSVKGAYGWNESLKADYNAFSNFTIDTKGAETLRKAGFGTVLVLRKDGICRGTAAMLTLHDENHNKALIKDKAAACYSFSKGSSQQQYPSSLMGSIALLRQTHYDGKWYANAKQKEKNITLDNWNEIQKLPQLFESDDKLNTLRIAKIGEEFGITYVIKAGGNEYQRMEDIKSLKLKYILPLNFPEALDLSDPYDAVNVSLSTLKEWEMAPKNPQYFEKAGIDFAFTTDGLKDNLIEASAKGH
jgi:imidazolonepropionase-like amidohydrolase